MIEDIHATYHPPLTEYACIRRDAGGVSKFDGEQKPMGHPWQAHHIIAEASKLCVSGLG